MTHKDRNDLTQASEFESSELFGLVSKKLREAIEDTASTRAKLNATLDKLEQHILNRN